MRQRSECPRCIPMRRLRSLFSSQLHARTFERRNRERQSHPPPRIPEKKDVGDHQRISPWNTSSRFGVDSPASRRNLSFPLPSSSMSSSESTPAEHRLMVAAMAMQGLASNPEVLKEINRDPALQGQRIGRVFAAAAVEYADFLIAALASTPPPQNEKQ